MKSPRLAQPARQINRCQGAQYSPGATLIAAGSEPATLAPLHVGLFYLAAAISQVPDALTVHRYLATQAI